MKDLHNARERAAKKLAKKIMGALKKKGLKSRFVGRTIYVGDGGGIVVEIDDRPKSNYGAPKPWPLQVRMHAFGGRGRKGLSGTYKTQEGDFDEKKLTKFVNRIAEYAEEGKRLKDRAASEESAVFASFAAACSAMQKAGFKRYAWNGGKLPPVSQQTECEFVPKKDNFTNFRVMVSGSHRAGYARIRYSEERVGRSCPTSMLHEYAAALRDHHHQLHRLDARNHEE